MRLVDFVIGGAGKSGTTSLHEYFVAHPGVCMSRPKEPNFFSKHYEKGKDHYRKHFEHCNSGNLRGEASVSYLVFADRTAPRLKKDIPNVKLLFVLRNPVERAWSDYWFAVRQGRIRHEEGLFGKLVRGKTDISGHWRPQYGMGELIIQRGMYYDSLTAYCKQFDSEQIKVLLTEDLSGQGFQEACSFLGIPPSSKSSGKRANAGRYPSSKMAYTLYRMAGAIAEAVLPSVVHQELSSVKESIAERVFNEEERPSMNPETSQYLHDVYRTPNQKLEELIGRDLSHWN